MMPEEKVFHPRYPLKIKLAWVGSLVFAATGLLVLVSDLPANLGSQESLTGIACVVFFGFCAASWFLRPKKIEFSSVAITIRRRLLPDKRINYAEITDVGIVRLKAENGGFAWGPMENGYELTKIVNELIEEGTIPEYALEGEAVIEDLSGIYAIGTAGIFLMIIGFMMWFGLLPSRWLLRCPDWVVELVLPLGVLFILYGIIRNVWFGDPAP